MSFGRFYEEFEIGQVFDHYPGRTITEAEQLQFCMLTMNHHPLHIDANFASRSQHGQLLAVGTLVFSIVIGMSVADISGHAIANLEYREIKHLGPTFVGDTLYARSIVLDKRPSRTKSDRGIVSVETTAFNQDKVKVLSLQRSILIPLRAAGPSATGSTFWDDLS